MNKKKIIGRDPHNSCTIELTVNAGRIVAIEKSGARSDLFLSPGFVDLQVNGFAGVDFNSNQLTADAILQLTRALQARGVTTFLPTLITATEIELAARLRTIAEARSLIPVLAAAMPFVHLEGPHISPLDGYRGAHNMEFVREPSIDEFNRLQSVSGHLIGMVTLSPHFEGSTAYVAELVKRGVVVAIGHTHATPSQIKAAVDAGASLSTHLGNGIAQTINRHQNPLWSQLAEDRLTATFIADGHHLPVEIIQVMLRAKGIHHSILISDSVVLAGMLAGLYSTPVGGKVELHADGRLSLTGTELLAGSTATLPQCISFLIRECGIAIGDAVAMATENPGCFVGRRGRLQVGAPADLVRFSWNGRLQIHDVWLGGEPIQTAPALY